MNWFKLSFSLFFFAAFTGVSWGQGFELTSLQSNPSVYTACDSTLSLSTSVFAPNPNASFTSDVNFMIDGNNFGGPAQYEAIVYWGDGTSSTHLGGSNTPGYPMYWNPPITHTYNASTGNYNVIMQLTNPQNGSTVVDTLVYNDALCNANFYCFAPLDCDNDGTTDSTIANGVPIILSNGTYTYTGTLSNGMVSISNMLSGTYTITVDQNWLDLYGYSVESIAVPMITIQPGNGTFTTQISLICDTTTVQESCVSGYIFCDQDQNGSYSWNDIPLYNAPILITSGGTSITVYSNMSGYYQTVINSANGTPAVVMVNPNWLAVNGYTAVFTAQTVLTSDCSGADTVNIPVNCNGDTTCSTSSCVGVYVFCDANNNGVMDSNESPIPNAPVSILSNMMSTIAVVYTDANGYAEYCSNYMGGSYVFAQVNQYWLQQHGYAPLTSLLTLPTQNSSNPTAAFYAVNCGGTSQCADLWTTVTPWIGYYQGNTAYIKLSIGNYGPGTAGMFSVSMNFPAGVVPIPSSIDLPGYTISGNTISWNLTNATSGYYYVDIIQFSVPSGLPSGTAHYYTSTISATNNTTDCNTTNNAGNLLQLVGSSYDPNDKLVDQEMYIDPATTETMTYVVRFQNTGTAPAQNIYIIDSLSSNLDWSTFEVLESSHTMQVVDMGNGIKRFEFPQIWLPDTSVSQEESQGHLVYRIRENATNGLGSEIKNTAYIYFDWNDAIITNTTHNINSSLGIGTLTKESLRLYPNPATSTLSVAGNSTISSLELVDLTGHVLYAAQPNANNAELSVELLSSGMYIVNVQTTEGTVSLPFVKK